MLRKTLAILAGLGLTQIAFSQQPSQPQVKVNVLNVCAPSVEEQQQIASALSRIPKQPTFSPDFEIDRGRSTLDENPGLLQSGSTPAAPGSETAAWVRIRHEFSGQTMLSTIQYSFSVDKRSMVETLVFHVRDPKDLLEIAIEDGASAVTTPATMLATNTPVHRIRLERFGKSSTVLARCAGTENAPPPDQSAYEPLFQDASKIMEHYRTLLAARSTVPQELARVGSGAVKPAAKPAAEKMPAASSPK